MDVDDYALKDGRVRVRCAGHGSRGLHGCRVSRVSRGFREVRATGEAHEAREVHAATAVDGRAAAASVSFHPINITLCFF